jgi:L-ascorbate metabolism protein UlaG (beta-lactamase superfamily)
MLPDEVLIAAQDLRAKNLLAVHSSKFAIALHAWDEPLSKIAALSKDYDISLLTPMIGELVDLDDEQQSFTKWWEHVDG